MSTKLHTRRIAGSLLSTDEGELFKCIYTTIRLISASESLMKLNFFITHGNYYLCFISHAKLTDLI